MFSSTILLILTVALLAAFCFSIGQSVNPDPKEEKKKTPEEEFSEAIAKYLKELRQTGSEAKKD